MTATDNPETLETPAPVKPGVSRVAMALLAFWIALAAGLVLAPEGQGVLTFLFVLAGWLLSVCVHEFGHAYVAHLGGDTTIRGKGYLRLDPLKYTNLSTSIVIPILALALGGIGFPGGAVYIREDLIRGRRMRSLTSLAGPAGTLAVMLGLVLFAIAVSAATPMAGPLGIALAFLIFLQATALVLNLLPIPGLDGYGVIRPFLPRGLQRALRRVERFSLLLLLALVFFIPGGPLVVLAPALLMTDLLGVPREAIAAGWDAFTFWTG